MIKEVGSALIVVGCVGRKSHYNRVIENDFERNNKYRHMFVLFVCFCGRLLSKEIGYP